MLVEITERAMAHCGSQEVLIVGGVGCKYVAHYSVMCLVLLGHMIAVFFIIKGFTVSTILVTQEPKLSNKYQSNGAIETSKIVCTISPSYCKLHN